MSAVQVNFLHLTDLHLGADDALERGMRTKFFEDLEKRHDRSGPWDLVLFTGDVTNRGASAEFDLADAFLDELLRRLERLGDHPVVLAVPGNHDLVRPSRSTAAVRELLAWESGGAWHADFWSDPDSEHRQIVEAAFANYARWWERRSAAVPELRWGLLPGDFSYTFTKDGVRLGIVGLNLAFCHLADAVAGSMGTGAEQLQAACGDRRGAFEWAKERHASVLLTHHPPDWLGKASRIEFDNHVADPNYFAGHFFGHCHLAHAEGVSLGLGAARHLFQGMSLFGLERFWTAGGGWEQRLHGYAAGRIEITEKSARVSLWPRAAGTGGGTWRFQADAQHYELVDDGESRTRPAESERSQLARLPAAGAVPGGRGEAGAARPELVLTVTVRADRRVELRVGDRRVVRGRVELGPAALEAIELFQQWLVARIWDTPAGTPDQVQLQHWRWLQAMGSLLYDALFNGDVGGELEHHLRRTLENGRPDVAKPNLRVNLRFDGADDLACLPWEYMFYRPGRGKDRGGAGYYLSAWADLSLSRFSQVVPADDPLQIIEAPQLRLQLVQLRKVAATLGDKPVELNEASIGKWTYQYVAPDRCETWSEFAAAGGDGAGPGHDVVHLVAEARSEKGTLHQVRWPAPEGMLGDDEIVKALGRRKPVPRLVVLQLHEEGDGIEQCVAGLAQRLISAGVRFVVALQHGVSDATALAFLRAFYQQLGGAVEEKQVAAAVQKGRAEINTQGEGRFLFGKAVLYLCSDLPLARRRAPPAPGPGSVAGTSQEQRKPEEKAPPGAGVDFVATAAGGAAAAAPAATTGAASVMGMRSQVGTGALVLMVAALKQAALDYGKESRCDDEVRKALAAIPWRDLGPKGIRVYLEKQVYEGETLPGMYQAMLKALDRHEAGTP